MTLIQQSKELVRCNRIKQITDSLFEVGDYKVGLLKKKGRSIMTCTCFNSTIFCVEGICSHKISVLIYLSDNNFHKKIDKIISDYKRYNELSLPVSVDYMLNDLENLKRVK